VDQDPSSRHEPNGDGIVLLIVEDHFDTRWATAAYLRDAGYRVIEAGDAKEAMSVLSAGTHVDIVFSDINMPGDFNGNLLAQWIAKHHPSVPVLLTSGAPGKAHIAATGSARAFIAKPCDPTELIRLIEAML
jgi:DNA-binding NtrC family response regulator